MTSAIASGDGLEYRRTFSAFRCFLAAGLAAEASAPQSARRVEALVFTLVVLSPVPAGFALAFFAGIDPDWATLAGALFLAGAPWSGSGAGCASRPRPPAR